VKITQDINLASVYNRRVTQTSSDPSEYCITETNSTVWVTEEINLQVSDQNTTSPTKYFDVACQIGPGKAVKENKKERDSAD
jgi:hypothetical protein